MHVERMDAAAVERVDGLGGREGEAGDAVMRNMIPTPDQSLQNSMVDDTQPESSRPHIKNDTDDLIHRHPQQLNKLNETLPLSPENSQLPSQSPPQITESQSPPTSNMNTLLPSLHPSSPLPHGTWTQAKSPSSGSNPFYTSQHSYRSSTPPIPSSAEQSPLISPAKRFSTGEVKPLYTPNSPRQPLNEEDRLKFSQASSPLPKPQAPSVLTLL